MLLHTIYFWSFLWHTQLTFNNVNKLNRPMKPMFHIKPQINCFECEPIFFILKTMIYV